MRRQGRQDDQHVPRLLDRHPIAVSAAHAIDLPERPRIRAEIVRRVVVGPQRRRRVVEHRHQHGFGQRRTEHEEERSLGEQHIHGTDAAVGKILLGKYERHAAGICRQFVAGPGLPIGQRAQRGVLVPARGAQSIQQDLVILPAPIDERRVIAFCHPQQVGRLRAVASPVGTQPRAKILDRVEIVVRQQQVPRCHGLADRAQVEPDRALADDFGLLVRRRRDISVAPFDPQVVTSTAQDPLVSRANPEHGEALHGRLIPAHRLIGRVHRQFATQAELELNGVRLAVCRLDGPRDVSHRSGQHVQVGRQGRRQESQRELHLIVGKLIDRARGPDRHAGLRQGDRVGRLQPHDAKQLSIHSNRPAQRMWPAGPVRRLAVGQPIGR